MKPDVKTDLLKSLDWLKGQCVLPLWCDQRIEVVKELGRLIDLVEAQPESNPSRGDVAVASLSEDDMIESARAASNVHVLAAKCLELAMADPMPGSHTAYLARAFARSTSRLLDGRLETLRARGLAEVADNIRKNPSAVEPVGEDGQPVRLHVARLAEAPLSEEVA